VPLFGDSAFVAGEWPGPFYSSGSIPFQVAPTVSSVTNSTLSTPHTGGMIVALGDGSVRVVTRGVSAATWVNACVPNDGVTLGSDW